MARAVKDTAKSADEKIADVDNEILAHQKAISELKAKKRSYS